ncbi:uncharacterized protein LOC125631062 [Caretta caretta]|uniref:uncharacterized protein LOC125631062 n=1 Tax=Caretta caretta TaxID=8467 RepID=UPI00209603F9|nr:uncharacterized protein LOC125631062 [Caretta caretta]
MDQLNEEFDAVAAHTESLQKLKNVSGSYGNKKLKLLMHLTNRKKSVLETEKLGKTLQSLHLDVIASQQKHKVELAQLEQQITQLERDVTDAKELCCKKDQVCSCYENEQNSSLLKNHIAKEDTRELEEMWVFDPVANEMLYNFVYPIAQNSRMQYKKYIIKGTIGIFLSSQAIRKRDDLLRKSEADLLQAREGIKAKVAEVEHLDSVVKKLKASIQDTQKEKNQKKREAIILRTEIQQLNQELQDVHKQYRETAPELASQDEKLLLMESSLKATQEQLSEQITETVHQEQSSRKSQTELQTLRERIIASEEGIRDYKLSFMMKH